MKRDQLKKNLGMLVRFRPAAKNLGDEGLKRKLPYLRVEERDDVWRIAAFEDKYVVLSGITLPYEAHIGYDHIREFVSDTAIYADQQSRGFLKLKVQVLINGVNLQYEPI